jgi:hypothetical protein
MASEITSSFAFNREELKDWSKVINELTFGDPALNELHDIEQGIKYNQQIVFAGRMGLMGKTVTGCTPNAVAGVALTEKTWTPVDMDFRLEHCSADVNAQDKLIRQMSKMNPDFYNVIEGSSSVVGNFLVAKVVEGFNENLLRQAWFEDTAAALTTGGGVFKVGTDLGFFNSYNGFFKQIFTEIPSTDAKHVTITKNAAASYALQALASGDAIATLKAMYLKADSRLLDSGNAKFYVTRTIFDGYLNDLESIQNTGAGNTIINENGQITLTYRGIPVVKMDVWDRVIAAYQDNGTKWNLPHRAVLSTPMNLKIGTLSTDDFGTLDAFYDQYHKVNVIDGVYTMDAKLLEKYLTVAAY